MAKAKSASAKIAGGTSKTKAKATSDVFLNVAKEVENLDQAKAFALVHDLSEGAESTYFRLGGILAHIQDKSSVEGGEAWLNGHKSFRDLIEQEFKLHYRKAMYLIKIYKALVEKQIPWSVVANVGWTKLRELADILTAKNAESWAKKAEKLTVDGVIAAVKKAKSPGSDAAEKTVTKMTFALHKDQAEAVRQGLDKAKSETKTEHDTVALYNVMQGYLGNSVEIPVTEAEAPKGKPLSAKAQKAKYKADLTELMGNAGVDLVLEVFGEVFPKVDIEVKM